MKTKRIKSKKEQMIFIFDILLLLLCIFRCRSSLKGAFEIINAFKAFDYNIFIIILLVVFEALLLFFLLIYKNMFIIALYLAYRIPRKRVLKKNSKYEVIDNIEYYRERFIDITPSEISLITDLEIETKKDFAATVLDLYNRGYIDFKDTDLIVIEKDTSSLKESSKFCLDIIKNKTYSGYNVSTWKDLCISDAINDNLIVENGNKNLGSFNSLSIFSRWILVLVLSIFIGACYAITPIFHKTINDYNRYSETTENLTENDIVELIKTDNEFHDFTYWMYVESIPIMVLGTFIFISIIALISMPIYLKARKVTYKLVDSKDRFSRTRESKVLVEQIAGMKNFIHDFSNLSNKEKENVKLWNEFLIYAVVLEENDSIINDIFKYKNADIKVVDVINKEIDVILQEN